MLKISWSCCGCNAEQYGLNVDDHILKSKTECMLFGTKIGKFDNLKDVITYYNHHKNN